MLVSKLYSTMLQAVSSKIGTKTSVARVGSTLMTSQA
jgi:hypothetical protein